MSRYKVGPEPVDPEKATVPFKKPIQLNEALIAYDETFARRKREVGQKFFTCKSGRKFCYFTDGAPDPSKDEVSVVLCLHGAGVGKTGGYLLKEPVLDIFQIVPDRMGHGGSSPAPTEGYSFETAVAEVMELVDAVYTEKNIPQEKKFFVLGHSGGATMTIEMGACPGVRDRIAAIAPISSPIDQYGVKLTKEERKKDSTPGFLLHINKKGIRGSFIRWLWVKCSFVAIGNDINKDWAWRWKNIFSTQTGGDKRSRDLMNADPYFVTGQIDSFIPGYRTPQDAIVEFGRISGGLWSYDPSEITMPCFLYNEGGKNPTVPPVCAEYHHRLIKGSELILWEGHGHVSITMEIKNIMEALVKKEKAKKPNYEQ